MTPEQEKILFEVHTNTKLLNHSLDSYALQTNERFLRNESDIVKLKRHKAIVQKIIFVSIGAGSVVSLILGILKIVL